MRRSASAPDSARPSAAILLDLELRVATLDAQIEAADRATRAVVDPLTALSGGRAFQEALDREWRRSRREGAPLAVIKIGVDDLRSYNDNFGRSRGDTALRHIATTLRLFLRRPGDLLARYVGASFAAVLPGTTLQGARQVAEDMQRGVHAMAIPQTTSRETYLTVYVGVSAATPSAATEWEELELLAHAGHALADARSSGKYPATDPRQAD